MLARPSPDWGQMLKPTCRHQGQNFGLNARLALTSLVTHKFISIFHQPQAIHQHKSCKAQSSSSTCISTLQKLPSSQSHSPLLSRIKNFFTAKKFFLATSLFIISIQRRPAVYYSKKESRVRVWFTLLCVTMKWIRPPGRYCGRGRRGQEQRGCEVQTTS